MFFTSISQDVEA